ncbi:UPF0103-domain-containing protein, partial [Vararia minispora EC-137]
ARQATHADSWYTGNGITVSEDGIQILAQRLDADLSGWLGAVKPTESETFAPPVKGCKAIIAPHAGYSYSGPAAAWAYKSIDTTGIRRVFILGPSHHVYLDGCALTQCTSYVTPLGELPIDLSTVQELKATGQFEHMSLDTDENEHSIEMHLPYIRKIFQGKDIVVVPVLVGAISKQKEEHFGRVLAPYFDAPDTVFVVSSDFCHWGTRFSYTFYYPNPPPSEPIRLSRTSAAPSALKDFPIHASISALDHEGMDALTMPPGSPSDAHTRFAEYLTRTKNTICGRHPIGVLLGVLAARAEGEGKSAPRLQWVRYEQSSACETARDSSVSYASAYVVC